MEELYTEEINIDKPQMLYYMFLRHIKIESTIENRIKSFE